MFICILISKTNAEIELMATKGEKYLNNISLGLPTKVDIKCVAKKLADMHSIIIKRSFKVEIFKL